MLSENSDSRLSGSDVGVHQSLYQPLTPDLAFAMALSNSFAVASAQGSKKKRKLGELTPLQPKPVHFFQDAPKIAHSIDHLRTAIDELFDIEIENIPSLKRQDYLEQQKLELHKLLKVLIPEIGRNAFRNIKKGPSAKDEKESGNRNYNRRFKSRVDMTCSLLKLLFKTEDSDAVIALLALLCPKSIAILQNAHGLNVKSYRFSEHQVLHMKHHIGGSATYRMMERVGRGLSSASEGFIKFPLAHDVSKYKNQLPIGTISIFRSPYGTRTGRFWKFGDMLQTTCLSEEHMKHFHPIWVDGHVTVLVNIHIDGTPEHSFASLVACVAQLMNFDLPNVLDSLQILFLEEWKEDVLLFWEMFQQVLMPSIKELYVQKVPLLCIGTGCEMCAGSSPTATLETGKFSGKTVHFGNLDVTYTNDTKATKMTLNISESQAIECHTNLRVKDHNNSIKCNQNRTLKQLQEVNHATVEALHAFTKNKRQHGLYVCDDKDKEDLLDEFHSSKEYAKGVTEKFGGSFKNILMDDVTPIEHYIRDMLHLKITVANLVNSKLVIGLLVQEIEKDHIGIGPHAYLAASKAASLGHQGERLKQRASLRFKDKVIKLCNNRVISSFHLGHGSNTVPLLQAIVDEFIRNLESLTLARLKELTESIANFHGHPTPQKFARKNALVVKLVAELSSLEADDIVNNIMSAEEYEKLNEKLSYRRVDKVMSAEPLQMGSLASEGGVKLNGNDSDIFWWSGGGETMIKMLNKNILEAHIEANTGLNKLMKNIHDSTVAIDRADKHVETLLNRLGKLRNMGFVESEHAFSEDVNEMLGVLELQHDEIAGYRADILSKGHEIINLYYGNDKGATQPMHPLCAGVLRVFLSLQSLLRPFCVAPRKELFNSLEAWKQHCLQQIQHHPQRRAEYLEAVNELNVDLGEHSDYMHFLLWHGEAGYCYTLNRWNKHIGEFQCQTSEHFNKVAKRMLDRLHGFTHRSMHNKGADLWLWKNKFGFVMQEFQIKYIHFFSAICKMKRHVTCSSCHVKGHRKETCPIRLQDLL